MIMVGMVAPLDAHVGDGHRLSGTKQRFIHEEYGYIVCEKDDYRSAHGRSIDADMQF